MFEKVLVANRGEVAVRVLRTLRAMGITGVAVTDPADRAAVHADHADEVVHMTGADRRPYLSVEAILDAARRTGATAIHPGYGFLSESWEFAQGCADAGLIFIGPPVAALRAMGDKIVARRIAVDAGVPVVAGAARRGLSDEELSAAADDLGYPVLVKAAAGGGGRGMRVVDRPDALAEALASARREATAAFGDGELFLERIVAAARHVEVQIVADGAGTVWALQERECSLQRRYQKIVEESPSPAVDAGTRQRLLASATRIAQACGYVGAGTVEFLLPGKRTADDPLDPLFMEMNTRLQVEHPVTELVHDVDLVEWQVRIAAGHSLPPAPPPARGHAVEARLYAEDPARGFLPTGGEIRVYREPRRPGVRIDSGVAVGTRVGANFDPLLAKINAVAADRETALARVVGALRETAVLGVVTNNAFLQALLTDDAVQAGHCDTGLVEARLPALVAAADAPELARAAPVVAAVAWLADRAGDTPGWRLLDPAAIELRQAIGGRNHHVRVTGSLEHCLVEVDGDAPIEAAGRWRSDGRLGVTISGIETPWDVVRSGSRWDVGRAGRSYVVEEAAAAEAIAVVGQPAGGGLVRSPLPGTVAAVDVAAGDHVVPGQRLVVVEAMKMEHPVAAPAAAVVRTVHVSVGEPVAMGAALVVLEPDDAGPRDTEGDDT